MNGSCSAEYVLMCPDTGFDATADADPDTVCDAINSCAPGSSCDESCECVTGPVPGACGTEFPKTYAHDATGYGSDVQCANGTPSNTEFPTV